MYRQQTWRGNWESMGGAAQLRRRSSICVFVFPLSRRCHTTLGTLFRSHPLAPGSFLTILCADVVAHATPFTSLTLPPTSLFSSALGAFGLQDCGMQSRPRLSPSTFACLSPNVQLNFSLCSILFSVEYLSYRTISQFHALHVEHLGKTLFWRVWAMSASNTVTENALADLVCEGCTFLMRHRLSGLPFPDVRK